MNYIKGIKTGKVSFVTHNTTYEPEEIVRYLEKLKHQYEREKEGKPTLKQELKAIDWIIKETKRRTHTVVKRIETLIAEKEAEQVQKELLLCKTEQEKITVARKHNIL